MTATSNEATTSSAISYANGLVVTILAATANANKTTIDFPANHSLVIGVGAAAPCGDRKHLTLDDALDGGAYSQNEARLHPDLSGETQVDLERLEGVRRRDARPGRGLLLRRRRRELREGPRPERRLDGQAHLAARLARPRRPRGRQRACR